MRMDFNTVELRDLQCMSKPTYTRTLTNLKYFKCSANYIKTWVMFISRSKLSICMKTLRPT